MPGTDGAAAGLGSIAARPQLAPKHCVRRTPLVSWKQVGNPVHIANLRILRGVYAFYTGDWAQAHVDFEHALTVTQQIDASRTYAYGYALFHCGLLCLGEGDWEVASRYCDESITILESRRDFQGQRPAATL